MENKRSCFNRLTGRWFWLLVGLFRLDSRGGTLSEEETFKPDLNDIKVQAPLRPEAREGRGGKGSVKQRELQCRGCKKGVFLGSERMLVWLRYSNGKIETKRSQ